MVVTRGSEATIDATAASYGMRAVPVSVIEGDARDALQHSIGLVLAVAVISVIIAMLAVINTLLVNVRQGTRELALLRAVGSAAARRCAGCSPKPDSSPALQH